MATAKSIKGTQTEKLLTKSYVAESCAYSRYTYYAQQATKEGLSLIHISEPTRPY